MKRLLTWLCDNFGVPGHGPAPVDFRSFPLWPVPTHLAFLIRELGEEWVRTNTGWVQLQVAYLQHALNQDPDWATAGVEVSDSSFE